jgi:hypothetical protein
MPDYEDIKTIVVNEERREPVVVKLVRNPKGQLFLNIRHHYYDQVGNLLPTAKGISVPLDDKSNLLAAVKSVTQGEK